MVSVLGFSMYFCLKNNKDLLLSKPYVSGVLHFNNGLFLSILFWKAVSESLVGKALEETSMIQGADTCNRMIKKNN